MMRANERQLNSATAVEEDAATPPLVRAGG